MKTMANNILILISINLPVPKHLHLDHRTVSQEKEHHSPIRRLRVLPCVEVVAARQLEFQCPRDFRRPAVDPLPSQALSPAPLNQVGSESPGRQEPGNCREINSFYLL